ncbi:S1 RNA-binding domain-containing protein [Streptomyces sp. CBMA29]|uniref:S1 RNA-binding domain-containing protein n=1 Tax=Streptomyces sp. CBMA29 TaxID=1896314 RepID=UPI001661BCF2|nr:S1 RNA-binding domain-containing protein [Streptomyces sp. CBMA29]MBD0738692.1 RNA-binding protein [Streptomyces sp. CBMA29]
MSGIPEHPELWAFLESLTPGQALSGTVTAIEPFGVFVALDNGPTHPLFPGVGFITYPELAWQSFDEATDVVQVGQRVTCEFLQFDTWNLEARLSLRAMQPDLFQGFADRVAVGQELRGEVTKVVPFGTFVRVDGIEGIEGFVHREHLIAGPEEPMSDVVRVGEEMTVVVTEVDRTRRRLSLARQPPPDDSR